jgi:RNA polymerase sigma-70 factor (ECF subfamily)
MTPEPTNFQPERSLPRPSPDDADFLARLRDGDEEAYMLLVEKYHAMLIRTALIYVHDRSVAEEVVQDTWIGFLQGLRRFEGRSTVKTWLFSILINRAKTQALRESHYVTAGDMLTMDDADGATVDPARFHPPGTPNAGEWSVKPNSWEEIPEERMLSLEVREMARAAIDRLPPMQQQVITLRDVEGWDAEQVCESLNITNANQRVLLHRARAAVRRALELYLDEHDKHLALE